MPDLPSIITSSSLGTYYLDEYASPPRDKPSQRPVLAGVPSAIRALPKELRDVLTDIARTPSEYDGVKAMMDRKGEFSSPAAAVLAGIAMNPDARKHLDDRLNETWAERVLPRSMTGPREVIVGGGLHAAIYSAVRVATGHPMPIVLEQEERAGGVFAVSASPSFYLNSRNRPGQLGLPGQEQNGTSLNRLPGALLQPSDLGGDEYLTNFALAWLIRATLAASAVIKTGLKVESIRRNINARYDVRCTDGTKIEATRVLLATGLGDELKLSGQVANDRVQTFREFMRSMDRPFPLRGIERVAVVGAGDGGKTILEALTGQGPSAGWSVASLDYPNKIDWYGVGSDAMTRQDFENCNRSRYKGIARLLPTGFGLPSRVRPISDRASQIDVGFEGVYLNGQPYDHIVTAIGFNQAPNFEVLNGALTDFSFVGNRYVGKNYTGYEVYQIGPMARIPFDAYEQQALRQAAQIPENTTALFRYADRTAALAASLPD